MISWAKPNEAIQDYSMTISLKPNDADAYYYRGVDREKLGNTDSAIADYKNAVIFGRADAEGRLKALGRHHGYRRNEIGLTGGGGTAHDGWNARQARPGMVK